MKKYIFKTGGRKPEIEETIEADSIDDALDKVKADVSEQIKNNLAYNCNLKHGCWIDEEIEKGDAVNNDKVLYCIEEVEEEDVN